MDIDVGGGLEADDLADLVEELEGLGHHVRGTGRVQLTEAVGAVWEIVLWLRDNAAPEVVAVLTTLTAQWVAKRFGRRRHRPKAVRVILDSSGEVLSRVEIPEPQRG